MLNRLQATLESHGLWDVIDSLPPATSLLFQKTTIMGQSAIRVRLGFREQTDGDQASSWAYILLHCNDLEPPVLIWDELPLVHVRPGLYRRAASSLLRVSGELLVPFYFLQFDPPGNDNAPHVRNMLCALVLYYSLTIGLTDTAIHWAKFESSLLQALEYIDNSTDYQRWRTHPEVRPNSTTRVSELVLVAMSNENTEEEIDRTIIEGIQEGGTLRSAGSSVFVKAGTNIAKLMQALGDRVTLLDAIPPTPIVFNRQDFFPTYSPSRMYFGRYGDANVYVYLTQDLKGSTKILAQHDGEFLSWKFSDLGGLQLVEPFAYIMTLKQDLKTRGNKIRYLVFYYFMLAENAGLISVPKTQTSFQSMIVPLCAACKNLEEADFDVDQLLQQSHSIGCGQDEQHKITDKVSDVTPMPSTDLADSASH